MIRDLIILFFIANALFWGLATHTKHCELGTMLGMKPENCPPHWIHVYVMGLGSFIIALYLKQGLAGF